MKVERAVLATAGIGFPAALAFFVWQGLLVPTLNVVDGDTLRFGDKKVRLATHDAPELFNPRCQLEHIRALQSKGKLEELLAKGYSVRYVNCAGGNSTDKYGRYCAIVSVGGENVGDTLIREGLAVRFGHGKPDWCKQ